MIHCNINARGVFHESFYRIVYMRYVQNNQPAIAYANDEWSTLENMYV